MKPNTMRAGIYLTLATAIYLLSGYITNVWLGRHFGPGFYGKYGVIISLMTVINLMQTSGLPQATSKFIAANEEQHDSILRSSLKLQIISSLCLALLFFILAEPIAHLLHDNSLSPYLRASAAILPIYGIYALYLNYYNGRHLFKRQAVVNIAYSAAKLIFVILLAVVWGLYGVITGFVIAPLIALLFGFRWPKGNSALFPRKQLISFSIPLIIFSVAVVLQLSIDLILLKRFSTNSAIPGYYTAAQNIATIPYLGVGAIGQILFPSVSRFLGAGRDNDVREIVGSSVRYLLLLILPIVALIAATAPVLIRLLFGHKYLPATTPLRILLAGYVLLTLFAMLSSVLNGAGHTKTSMKIAASGVVIGFVSCLILIPRYGANGAALGTLAGSIVVAASSTVEVYRIFRFEIPYISILKSIVCSLLIFTIGWVIHTPVLLLPLIYVLLGIIYALALHLMGEVTLEDRSHIRNLLPSWIPFTKWL